MFLFLNTDDFWRDYHEMVSAGIRFVRDPKKESYGMAAVFEDLYGNLWDLLELNHAHSPDCPGHQTIATAAKKTLIIVL